MATPVPPVGGQQAPQELTAQVQVNALPEEHRATLSPAGVRIGNRLLEARDIAGLQPAPHKPDQVVVHWYGVGQGAACFGRKPPRLYAPASLRFVGGEREAAGWVGAWKEMWGRGWMGRVVVVVNPAAGLRKAGDVARRTVLPMLAQAGVTATLLTTTHPGHAEEHVRSMPPGSTDAIVVVGGDGLLHEVANGLLARADASSAPPLPFGVVGAGTGNGVVTSLFAEAQQVQAEQAEEEEAAVDSASLPLLHTLAILRAKEGRVDVCRVSQQGRPHRFSLLSFATGLVAEIDIDSDALRWLGPARVDVTALLKIAALHASPALLSLTRPDGSVLEIAGELVCVWALLLPFASDNALAAPSARRGSGAMEVLVVRKGVTRLQLLAIFLSLHNGGHVGHGAVECYRAVDLRFSPASHTASGTASDTAAPPDTGLFAIDGELAAVASGGAGRLPGVHAGKELPFHHAPLSYTLLPARLSVLLPA